MNTQAVNTESIDTAVIVAAGRSSRLYPLTENTPKGLLEIGGESILGRSVRLLREAGIRTIHVVTGFHDEKVREHLGDQVTCISNPFYASCNNMGSLWMARSAVTDATGNVKPFLYLHGDVIYDADLLPLILQSAANDLDLLVDPGPTDAEAMKVRAAGEFLIESSKDINPAEAAGEWIGLTRFSARGAVRTFDVMEQLLRDGHLQGYDTLAFTHMAQTGSRIGIVSTDGLPWVEIDDVDDLERAKGLFGVCAGGQE